MNRMRLPDDAVDWRKLGAKVYSIYSSSEGLIRNIRFVLIKKRPLFKCRVRARGL